jgi:tetratricopeptide (TPR) repeat protein
MLLLKRIQELIQVPVHDLVQLVERQVDPVVGHAPLREVVSADALRAVAASDLQAARLRLGALLLFLLGGQQASFQQGHGARAVLVLRALILTLHHDAARQVGDANGGVRLVDVLPAGAGRAVGVDPQVRRVDLDFLDLVELGEDGNGDSGCVNTALSLRVRYSLHAMGARLELQARERAAAGDAGDDFLIAAVLARVVAQDFDREAFRFGIAPVHAQQIACKKGGLIATRAGPDLEEDVLVVPGILGHEQLAQLVFFPFDRPLHPGDFLGPEVPHAGVRVVEHLPSGGQIALQAAVAPETLRQRLQPRVFHRQVAKLLGTAGNVGRCEQAADLFEPVGHLLETLADGVLHCGFGPFEGAAFSGIDSAGDKERNARRQRRPYHTPVHPTRTPKYPLKPAMRHAPAGARRFTLQRALKFALPGAVAAGLAVLLTACATTPSKVVAEKHDPAALTVVAEIALKRGDCKGASETYASAAAIGSASLAKRASQVALACEHLPAAWTSVNRWRSLAPDDREADATYAAVALKLYRIPDARAAIGAFTRAKPAALESSAPERESSAAKAEGAAPEKQEAREIGLPELTALLLDHSDASTVLSAMSGALDGTNPAPDTLALLGELALDSYDAQRAEHYAQLALDHDPGDFAAKRILARAYVVRGEGTKAIAEAREVMSADTKRGAFELAEILASLDRIEEAHQELDRLRSAKAPEAEVNRRLALLAYDSGDLEEAQQRFAEMVTSGQGDDSSLLYLADIAARTGDPDTALAAYKKLTDSSVALSARSRAAALLLTRKDRAGAMSLFDDYSSSHPESEFELTLAKARLLADHGEADTGLSLLGAALERHPAHPSIEYDRAVILERAGRVHESVETLERLLTQRPDDPVLTNALGYTLADHNLELPRAETLIRRALTVSPDSPAVLDSLGWVRYRQGDAKGAVPMLARAYSIDHDSEIAAHWGEALWQSGAHSDARRVWAAALARDPNSDTLKATMARFIPDSRGHQ